MESQSVHPVPPPAALLRRMQKYGSDPRVELSSDESAPLVRCEIESTRGHAVVELTEIDTADVTIQWMQNGTPLQGQDQPVLHLAELSPADTDIYYAIITEKSRQRRSQSLLLAVYPGYPMLDHSARAYVSEGKGLTKGFVVAKAVGPVRKKRYLLRVIGPSLKKFDISRPLMRPVVTLSRRNVSCQGLLQTTDPRIREWEQKAGAFKLDNPEQEFVASAELPPGSYSLTIQAEAGDEGEVLVEIYELNL
ncbi:hypothetical protein [Synoicihabitans lomoniglobus]|uniref:Ig-like domain-containing protein n=1 Tax=Synoicihabitans lomoniglobus TaxID=2909285 RepID=A0AAF0CRG5_9BACT|nr:hypothetical protein [Opitutaceae bacterium LMO-M01]WED66737.1 hypothetical protein PXH66_07730 [Opitutaceae bacterium LMO-M01]